jgi:hypothetical protein
MPGGLARGYFFRFLFVELLLVMQISFPIGVEKCSHCDETNENGK